MKHFHVVLWSFQPAVVILMQDVWTLFTCGHGCTPEQGLELVCPEELSNLRKLLSVYLQALGTSPTKSHEGPSENQVNQGTAIIRRQ